MTLPVQQLSVDFYNVAANSSALVTLIPRLIHAEELKDATPAVPFGALRRGPITGEQQDVRRLTFTWWWYGSDFYTINSAVALCEAAYPRDALAFCEVLQGTISAEVTDAALGLLARSIAYTVLTRR